MRSLSSLDLSCNRLSGDIPTELERLEMNAFIVSSNNLSGHVPDVLDKTNYKEGFLGNQRLCGGRNLMLPRCSSPHKLSPHSLATILVPPLLIVALALCTIYLCRSSLRKPSNWPSWKLTPFISTKVDESYILRNLKEDNLIASGGAAKVHKVILPNGEAVAVKKIPNKSRTAESLERKGDQEEKERWKTEVDILGLIRHNNIILKLQCCISSEQSHFKLLVYEFMPNGTLFDRLHGGAGPHARGAAMDDALSDRSWRSLWD